MRREDNIRGDGLDAEEKEEAHNSVSRTYNDVNDHSSPSLKETQFTKPEKLNYCTHL